VSEQRDDYELNRRVEQTSLTSLREAEILGITCFVGGPKDAAAEGVSSAVRPEEIRSGNKFRSEKIFVASPARVRSG
jgi:hypothetical protein